MKTKRICSLLAALILALGVFPASVSAEAAADITVYLTVSNQGTLAADNDGKAMANRPVTVKDIDEDGTLTYDEALVAAHKAYNSESGYSVPGGSVSKLWNIDTYNTLFFNSNKGLSVAVTASAVNEGDKLVASINKDGTYYADWYTFFDADTKAVTVGEPFSLTLKGHLGMAYTDADKADTALSGISVGTWSGGAFSAISGKTTADDGKVTLSFDTAGTYYVTASGTVKDDVTTDWSTGATAEKDCPIIAPVCVVTVTEAQPDTPAMSDEEAVEKIYDEFSKYSSYQSGLTMPLTYKGAEYSNIYTYIKDWAKAETGREVSIEATVSPSTAGYVDWSSGAAQSKSYTPLASDGTVTQGYFKNNSPVQLSYLKNITFTVGTKTSETISKLYISIPSLIRSDAEIVAYTKQNLPFARIANGNADTNHIVQAVGEKNGSTISLPNSTATNDLYTTQSVTTKWALNHISGKEDALKLTSNKITVSRPNVGEENAVFDLTATITSKNDTSVSDTVTYCLTVPAFGAATVPFQVTEGATLSLTDSYYGTKVAVADKYIKKQENAPAGYDLYHCVLHTNAAGQAQTFKYTVTKDGYITKSGSISVKGATSEATVIDLVASSEDDTKLATLKSIAPEFTIALDPDKTEYSVDVDGVKSIKLAGTPKISDAAVKITSYYKSETDASNSKLTTAGTTLTDKGVLCYLPDKAGTYKIEITVTAPNGSTLTEQKRVYTITVNKKSDSKPLTGLTLTASSSKNIKRGNEITHSVIPAEETMSPTFVAGLQESSYNYTVNYWRDQVSVKPTAAGCTIKVNGTTVKSGNATDAIPLKVGNNEIKITVTKGEATTEYIVNVRRKAEFYITDVTLDEGNAATLPPTDGSDWVGNCSFNHSADKIHVTYHTNLSAEDEKKVTVEVVNSGTTYSGTAGQPIELPVGTTKKLMPTTFLYYTAADGTVEGQKYVISYSRKGADAPSSVESYLPAPGQFVNTAAWREANKTLTGGSGITLGSFGGNVVYKYDEPIQNDPANPYGIDFIVFGNCFLNTDGSTSSGAAEPAAVMVSKDGETWYELAGSEYYTATARRGVTITWTNGDTTFTEAADTAWETDDGESGIMPKNEYHTQPYYPNPSFYNDFQTGIGKNESYNKNTVSFTGTMIDYGFHPFGYADSHGAKNDKITNVAANPYTGNDAYIYNGDGFDLDWAVDKEGNPVSLDEISYIKIYNATLSYGTSRGEISSEISQVLRAASAQTDVGRSKGLTSLSVNGKTISPSENNTYTLDAEKASVLKITPTAENANANIYVSNQYVKSGEEAVLAATEQVRIIVQEGECEPAIYMLNVSNISDANSNADLLSLTLTPGDTKQVPSAENELNFSVANSVSAVRFTPQTAHKKAVLSLSGGTLTDTITPASAQQSDAVKLNVGENRFTLKVTSANGQTEKTYTVTVTRESGGSGSGTSSANTIRVKFSLTGDTVHYDKDTKQYTGSHSNPKWIASQTVTLPKDVTVKYLTEMMLNNAGLDYKTDGVYVSEINGLAEYDNGPDSGWMYRHNGLIADEGYASRALENGDIIKWFYTDDYTKESGYEGNWDNVNSSGGTSSCTVKFETNGGSEIKSQSIAKNGTVTKPSNPTKNGYAFDGWYTDKALTVPYDFASKVTSSFTLYAKWEKAETDDRPSGGSAQFTDIEAGAWYENAVTYAISHNLFRGVSETEFAPNAAMTRAMLVTVLYRLEQAETVGAAIPFTDCDEDWYRDAVAWANENGIANGISDTEFAPNAEITREQTAAILYRYAQYKGYDTTQGGMQIREFNDAESISAYALDALTWAVNADVMHGTSDHILAPLDGATRAEIAQMLMRFCEAMNQ